MKKLFLILSLSLPIIVMAQDVLPFSLSDSLERQDTTLLQLDTMLIDTVAVDTLDVVLITDEMPNAIVHQDSSLVRLMQDKLLGRVRGEQVVDGFRVQVYASNVQQVAKNEALILKQNIAEVLEIPIYAISEPPFWKVRLGNFRTRDEANAYKEIFLTQFPEMVGSTYVVPDKIIIIQ